MRRYIRYAGTAVMLLLCCCLPVSAVIQEETYKGQVSTVFPAKNTLSIKIPQRYDCRYPAQGEPLCNWTPLDQSSLTATVPDPVAYTVFSGAESVMATNIGGDGGYWITLARVYGSRDTEQLVTDVVGDPQTLILPFIGDYRITTETIPVCSACSGTICPSSKAVVTIRSSGRLVTDKTIATGESFTYNGRNDGSSVMVTFISGEAEATSCTGISAIPGPQARSVFVIKVTPPAGYGQVNMRTATTTRPDEAVKPVPFSNNETSAMTPARPDQSLVKTQSAALSTLILLVSLICAACMVHKRW